MSAAAPTSPAVNRTQSTRRPSDRPHRAQSSTTRAPHSSSGTPSRSASQSQAHAHSHGRAISAGQAQLVDVARRDHEQSNVAQAPPPPRPSEDRERSHPPTTPGRSDSTRDTPNRSTHARYASAASAHGAAATNGSSAATSSRAHPHGSAPRGRRTMIDAPTGQWQLGKTIGAGSMGKVKLAKNVETGEQVAVKIIPRQSTDDHRSQADRDRADHSKEVRTAREAAIVSLVNHPYICGMKDVVKTGYHWYLLFEYVNGGQMLDYIISHGRLKEKQARKFARQIASALDYSHRNSIVHRDLKIENILISKDGNIKIIDFGLSNLFSPRSHLKTFCGSLYFAAPELLQAKHYTGPEVDVWSFGIVLYVLVCGKVPFDDQSMPQLHAKIKKGNVDYPPWLTTECRNLISRMLVTDSKQRASLQEIMSHPWMTKGYDNKPPDNFLPPREPLQLPLDSDVVLKMTGFDFGSPEYITQELTKTINSDEYQQAVIMSARKVAMPTPDTERKRGVFDFYKRRNSTTSRDNLTNPSVEAVQLGSDPVNAYSPLISIYYLVREKLHRERQEARPGALGITSPAEKPLPIPDLPAPQAAYTNANTYEMAGETPTGGRSRPRARTHGEEDAAEASGHLRVNAPGGPVSPPAATPNSDNLQSRKEKSGGGILRRFSTKKHKEPSQDYPAPPPSFNVSKVEEQQQAAAAGSPRKSFSVRRTREKDVNTPASLQPPSASHQPGLLTPPGIGDRAKGKLRGLARSTSVNSADLRRRMSRRGGSAAAVENPPPHPPRTSGSEKSDAEAEAEAEEGEDRLGDAASDETPTNSQRSRHPTSRAKSLGHARRESIQARRANRGMSREANVPEETTDHEQDSYDGAAAEGRSPETIKPVYLKGLFSVSTTSNKPLSFIRADIIRVLKQLGVQYSEVRGGFSCRHSPSIDLEKANEMPTSPQQPTPSSQASNKRRISFGGFMGGEKDREKLREDNGKQSFNRNRQRQNPGEQSYSNSDASDDNKSEDREEGAQAQGRPSGQSRHQQRPAGETTTQVQHDMGGSMVLRFEIVIVKVPLLSLHGLQFKKVDGGTWQYKNMAQKILDELRL